MRYDASYFEGIEAGYKLDRYKEWYYGVILHSILTRHRTFRACLDIGCAYGYFMNALEGRIDAPLIVGIDISTYAAKRARQITKNEVIVASSEALPFRNGTFDLVTALECIEHLSDLSQALLEIYRVLTSGGTHFASSPNRLGTSHLLERLGLLQSNPTHVKLYTAGALRKQLATIGFRKFLIRAVQMGFPLRSGTFVAISFALPFGSSLFLSAQK